MHTLCVASNPQQYAQQIDRKIEHKVNVHSQKCVYVNISDSILAKSPIQEEMGLRKGLHAIEYRSEL